MMMNDTTTLENFKENDTNTVIPPIPSTASSWAYDAGLLVEKGSILLSRIEPELACPDLDQPYLGKSLILIVEHDEDDLTQGIILNRPSDLRLDGDGNVILGNARSKEVLLEEFADSNTFDSDQWRMFFGGELSSPPDEIDEFDDGGDDEETLIVCLHNISTPRAMEVSEQILPGVYMTSHDSARSLVASGDASPDAFYIFYGFCGWEPDQLQEEVQKGSWYVASTDPKMLWDSLAMMRDESYDVRASGLEVWDSFIDKLGKRQEVVQESQGKDDFSDLMLKEWITQNLAADQNDKIDDDRIFRALQAVELPPIQAGSLLRASSQSESPFLLENQYLYKATILVLNENEMASVGAVLNLPTSDTYSLQINNDTFANFTIRYGGPASIISVESDVDTISGNEIVSDGENGEDCMMWLHCCAGMKYLRTGKPLVAGDEHGVWTCTKEQVAKAIELDFASVDDFMLVKGLCVWEKDSGAGGVLGQVMSGNLEVVSPDRIDGAWTMLRRQIFLKEGSFQSNIALADEAWSQAGDNSDDFKLKSNLGNQRKIFGSEMSAQELADLARSTWMKIHLLR